MRKAFNFYQSYWEQIKLLNDKQKLEIFNAICKVQFLEVNIEDITFNNNILNIVWVGIKHSIDTSLKGFLSKQKALGNDIKAPLTKGGIEAPYQQVQGEEQEEVKGEEQCFVHSDFKECFNKWLTYKKEKKQTYKSEISIESAYNNLIKLSKNNKDVAVNIIEQSIANNWAGLFELKTKSNNFIKVKNDSDW